VVETYVNSTTVTALK